MTQASILAAESSAKASRWRAPVWLLGWALAAAILVAQLGADAVRLKFFDPDNTMWLVSVRDMLAGQGLWDDVQHRLNPPDGTEMHWARWLTAAIAAPVALLTPIVGQAASEVIVAFVWPLALLAVFMYLVVRVSADLSEPDGLRTEASVAAALVAALAFPTIDKFAPGGFDHHGIELILALLAVLGLMRVGRVGGWGAVAGAALALALATAAEGAPLAVAGVLAAGLLWLFRPQVYRLGLAWFGLGLAGASAVLFAVLVPPSRWAEPVCDQLSTPFLGFALAAGAVAVLLGWGLPAAVLGSAGRRLAAAAVLGGVALAALWMLFPACAGGGYSSMSADMEMFWLAQISEARSLARLAAEEPWLLLNFAGAASAGLVAAGFYLRKRWREPEGWIVLAFLITGWLVMAWQVRGAFFATAFAIPFGAWATVRARQIWRSGTAKAGVLVFALAAVTSASAAWGAAGEQIRAHTAAPGALQDYQRRDASSEACVAPEAYESLTSIPPAILFNEFALGPSILQRTPHSVIAAQYHRNADGLMAVITAMRSSAEAAKIIVMKTQADYVVVCAALPETQFYAKHPVDGATAKTTLSSLLAAGTPPDWLEPVPLDHTPIKLYRIVR